MGAENESLDQAPRQDDEALIENARRQIEAVQPLLQGVVPGDIDPEHLRQSVLHTRLEAEAATVDRRDDRAPGPNRPTPPGEGVHQSEKRE